MGRHVRRIAIGLLVLLLVLSVAAVLFARSTRALQWAASQLSAAVAQSGGRLEFTGLSGSLFTAIAAARIDYAQADGLRATLTGVEIDPSLAALWNRQLVFDRIEVAEAMVERPASDEPASEPQSLALPLEVIVDRAAIGRASWRSGDTAIELAGISFAYRGGPARHEVDGLTVRLPGLAGPSDAQTLVVALGGGIDATPPFALAAKVRVSAEAFGVAELMLGGRLAEVDVQGTVAGSAPRAWAKARLAATVAPFAPTLLPAIRIAADGIDAAQIVEGAPGTALDLQIEASAAVGKPLRGRVQAVNRMPGEIGAQRVPVTGLDAGVVFDPATRRVELSDLRVALAGGGVVEGRGTVALPLEGKGPAFDSTWQLTVAALDLKALDARLAPTRLSGKIGLALTPDRQRFDVALEQRAAGRRSGSRAPAAPAASGTPAAPGASATAAATGGAAGALRLEAAGQRTGADLVFDRIVLRSGSAGAGAGAGVDAVAGGDGAMAGGAGEASGRGRIRLDGDRSFEADLQLRAFDPSRFIAAASAAGAPGAAAVAKAGVPPASINATVSARGRLQPAWNARIDATLAPSRFALAAPTAAAPAPRVFTLRGRVRGQFSATRVDEADILLSAGRNTLRATGSSGAPGSVLELLLDVNEPSLFLPGFAGQLNATARVTGDLRAPVATFTAKGARLSYAGQAASQVAATGDADLSRDPPRFDVALDARALSVAGVSLSRADLRLGGTTTVHSLSLALRGADLDAKLLLEGGLSTPLAAPAPRWAGRLVEARNDGRYPVQLAAPAGLELSPVRAMLAPARLQVGEGRVQVDELRWEPGRLATRGSIAAFPAGGLVDLLVSPAPGPAPATGAAGTRGKPMPPPPTAAAYASTLRIGGEWSLASTPQLNGTVTLRRESGDVSLRGSPPFALGLSQVALDVRFTDDRLQAQARLEGAAIGQGSASIALEPSPRLSMDSPMKLRADLALRTLKPFERYVGAFADIDGALSARIDGTGTPSKPQLSGSLLGERLRFNAPQLGVALRDGRLDARLADGVLDVVQLEAIAGEGTFSAKGRVPLREGIGGATLAWRADRMTLLSRPDRRVVVDGSGTLAAEKNRLLLAGQVAVREGYIEFGRGTRTALGEDVVVLGRKPAAASDAPRRSPLALRLDIDLGRAFRVVGSGLDAMLAGKVRIASAEDGTLVARGTINTERGTFAAFGQRLEVARGQLVFNGPVDNPGIDAVALRRLPSVEVGVQITGTVRALRVNTTSNPPMSQGEQLSWLVLGRSLENASQADAALVAGIAGSMLGGDGVPVTRRIAEAFGLDDIGIGGSSAIAGQVLTVGKRLSDRIYIAYEQAVTTATNLLRVDFELHRFVSLRAEAGAVSGFGIFYTRSLR